jgi:hypothetical protein
VSNQSKTFSVYKHRKTNNLLFLQANMGLKSRIGNRILSSKLSSLTREKKICNLDAAKEVGIIWESDQRESFVRIENELYLSGIKVADICYFPSKKAIVPEGVNGFTKKDTSWFSEVPKCSLAEDFIHRKFDILIDLTGQSCFPTIYLTALSEATFKIGYSGNSVNYFDLNIEFSEQPEAMQLAEQIIYYLTRINKTTIE